jgi:hypothetical protein
MPSRAGEAVLSLWNALPGGVKCPPGRRYRGSAARGTTFLGLVPPLDGIELRSKK